MDAANLKVCRALMGAVAAAMLASCGGGGGTAPVADGAPPASVPAPDDGSPTPPPPPPAPPPPAPTPIPAGAVPYPILFVTQVPTLVDFTSRASTFGNHLPDPDHVRRGGDLVVRYPDGTLRNLTSEAGFGTAGTQGATSIAVRDPSVHWDGTKAVFSMVVGINAAATWQLYEVTGLAKGETVRIAKVANQPTTYNNISPLYGTDDRILFTSDRPRSGERHLYPQLDEYEGAPTVTGIWSIDPTVATTGDLRLLNHAPSGAFSPIIDSFGRVIFTRWDHLQRDQLKDIDAEKGTNDYGAFNFSNETATALRLTTSDEVFPEPRAASTSRFGPVNGHLFNFFTPWQVNEDGTAEETLNHIGRHELNSGYMPPSFINDTSLRESVPDTLRANRKFMRMDGGLFQMQEDPTRAGTYYGIAAREFGSLSSNQIVKLTGGPAVNPQAQVLSDVTVSGIDTTSPGGRYRNPLPLASGTLIAAHTTATTATPSAMTDFRLKQLTLNTSTGLYAAGTALTPGIAKSVSGAGAVTAFSGNLWEIEPVEVRPRTRPVKPAEPLQSPEAAVLAEEGVDLQALRTWMKANDLALIVTRNQTSRDAADRQQPFNLRVPGGVSKTLAGSTGPTYDITHFQILQADQLRGFKNAGRRVLAQPMHDPKVINPPTTGPTGSVGIASDGSTAAFVPARRALAWQTTAADGAPVVRERVWLTFQPGEVRVCASCHGANGKDQSGLPEPTNKPEALRTLLRVWKAR